MTHTCSTVVPGGSFALTLLLIACSSPADPGGMEFGGGTPVGSDAGRADVPADTGTEPAFDSGTAMSITDASTADAFPANDARPPIVDAGPPPPRMPTLAAALHTCAVREGRLYCWGTNGRGELGLGDTGRHEDRAHLVNIPGGVVGVTASQWGTCALNDRQELYCWGQNRSGQVGQDTGGEVQTTPLRAHPAEGPLVYAAKSQYTTCGRRPNGETLCWGSSPGVSEDGMERFGVPRTSGPLRELSAGSGHVCAHLVDQTVECWGFAIDFLSVERTPRPVSGLAADVGALGVGSGTGEQMCVILVDGSVQCWGGSTRTPSVHQPTNINGLPGAATAVSLSGPHACALVNERIFCWGANYAGQLGLGDLEDRRDATEVAGLPGRPIEVAAGFQHTCASFEGGDIYCWGSGPGGFSSGIGTGQGARIQPTPTRVLFP